jgi:hypothetical protein
MAVTTQQVGGPILVDGADTGGGQGQSLVNSVLGKTGTAVLQGLDPMNLTGLASDYGAAEGRAMIDQGGQVFRSGQNRLDSATKSRTTAEQRIANIENLLGQNPDDILALDPYAYGSVAQQDFSALEGRKKKRVKQANQIDKEFTAVAGQINDLMAQATERARMGDIAGADTLKAQAQQLSEQWGVRREELLGQNKKVRKILGGDAFTLGQEDTLPAEELTNEMGRTVGNIVRQGRELSEGPGSEGYERMRGELQDPQLKALDYADLIGQRQLATGAKQGARDAALASRSRGGARSVLGEQALAQRSAENTAQARANLTTDIAARKAQIKGATSQFMAQWAPAFAMDSQALGRTYAQGGAGVREAYQNAITNIQSAAAQLATSYANTLTNAGASVLANAYSAQQQHQGELMELASSIASTAAMACHGAAAVFGWFTPDWYRARNWLLFEWKGAIADGFRAFYLKHSRKVAWMIKTNFLGTRMPWMRFFMWAAYHGSDEVK